MLSEIASSIINAAISIFAKKIQSELEERNNSLSAYRDTLRKYSEENLIEKDFNINLAASADVELNRIDVETSLAQHTTEVSNWSKSINFRDMRHSKKMSETLIELNLIDTPTALHIEQTEREITIPLPKVFENSNSNTIILGYPGAGKTTSIKYLCQDFLNKNALHKNYVIPILIRFRDMKKNSGTYYYICDAIAAIFPIQYNIGGIFEAESSLGNDIVGKLNKEHIDGIRYTAFFQFLNALSPVVFLDGFDEFPFDDEKSKIVAELREISLKCPNLKFVLTCRTGQFNYTVENAETYQISDLSSDQICELVGNWLEDEASVKEFLIHMAKSPYFDTSIRPLLLVHLCALYERLGHIPKQPKTIYRKLVELLVEDWDEQRSVHRLSKLSNFQPDVKLEFLASLAFYFTTEVHSTTFTVNQFKTAFVSLCPQFFLSPKDANLVLGELEEHTGLFFRSGFGQLEFSHLSFQEYLTAEYVVKLPSIPADSGVYEFLATEFAIAVSLSSNPSAYLVEFSKSVVLKHGPRAEFFDAFVSRLIIEHVEFPYHIDLPQALLTILTRWIAPTGMSRFNVDQQRLQSIDIGYFDSILEKANKVILLNSIEKHYRRAPMNTPVDGIVHYKRIQESKAAWSIEYILIPEHIFAKYLSKY